MSVDDKKVAATHISEKEMFEWIKEYRLGEKLCEEVWSDEYKSFVCKNMEKKIIYVYLLEKEDGSQIFLDILAAKIEEKINFDRIVIGVMQGAKINDLLAKAIMVFEKLNVRVDVYEQTLYDKNIKNIVWRDFQLKFFERALEYYKANDKGTMIVACGCGKTLMSLMLFMKLISKKIVKKQTMIIFVPVKDLVRQFSSEIDKFMKFNKITPDLYTIYKIFGDEFKSISSLEKDMELDKKMVFIVATYQSSEHLSKIKDFSVSFAAFDEAHHLCGDNEKKWYKIMMKLKAEKKLFMTATQKLIKLSGRGTDVISMDDIERFGNVFYRYDFHDAIKNGNLSNYTIKILINGIKEIDYMPSSKTNIRLTAGDMKFLLQIIKDGIENFKRKKILVYFNSIKSVNKFVKFMMKNGGKYNKSCLPITSDTDMITRKKIMKWFINDSAVRILSNVNIFKEGVDVPNIDCVIFAEFRRSQIETIQKIGRGLRKFDGKDKLFVILPFSGEIQKKDKLLEILFNISEIYDVDKLDEEMTDPDYIDIKLKKFVENKLTISKFNDKNDENVNIDDFHSNLLGRLLSLKIYTVYEKINHIKRFVERYNRLPNPDECLYKFVEEFRDPEIFDELRGDQKKLLESIKGFSQHSDIYHKMIINKGNINLNTSNYTGTTVPINSGKKNLLNSIYETIEKLNE